VEEIYRSDKGTPIKTTVESAERPSIMARTHAAASPQRGGNQPKRRPEWIRVHKPSEAMVSELRRMMRTKALHTVCEEAHCPNMGECWGAGTATFLMMGDTCTRACRFCDVHTGRPLPLDWLEPERVARAVQAMDLRHAVITSVNRDEREDGGAPVFAMVIRRIRELQPGCTVEVLIPDFKGSIEALRIVMDAHPDVLNHNVETIPRLFPVVQPQSRYEWSRSTLENAKALDPQALTKSGIMVGLGESMDEVKETIADLHSWGVQILTIGQYLQPSRRHVQVDRFYRPEEFAELEQYALEVGFDWVESAPLVRSSYHAAEQVRVLSTRQQAAP
jgi:lipoyl synthase